MIPKENNRTKGGYVYHNCTECNNEDTIEKPYKITTLTCGNCGKSMDGYFNNYCDNCGAKNDSDLR